MKTASEILEEQLLKSQLNKYGASIAVGKYAITEAMETYANQQTAKLRADNTLLKEVNEAQAFTIDKYKADKDRLAALLKEIKADIDFLGYYSPTATKITETLSECGY